MLRIIIFFGLALGVGWPVAGRAAPVAAVDASGVIRLDGLGAERLDRWIASAERARSAAVTVRVAGAARGAPPLAGHVERVGGGLRFVPRYPLAAGHHFSVTWRDAAAPGGAGSIRLDVRTAALERPPPRVVGFGPMAGALPANTLRLYVHFATPMRRDDATPHVALLDGAGRPIEQPFFAADGELWSADGTRLTLVFDPGRVKSGLAAHDRLGRALAPGGSVRLVVQATLPDAQGRALGQRFERRWAVTAADRASPDPDRWRLVAPRVGTRQAAVIELDEPVDAVLLGERVDILDADGAVVSGRIEVAPAGDRWSLVPEVPWRAGIYRWRVDARLEDHAGNALDGIFDRPAHVALRRFEGGVHSRSFTLGAPGITR